MTDKYVCVFFCVHYGITIGEIDKISDLVMRKLFVKWYGDSAKNDYRKVRCKPLKAFFTDNRSVFLAASKLLKRSSEAVYGFYKS